MKRILVLLAGLLAAVSAHAVEVAVGNLAAGTAHRTPVQFLVDGNRIERHLEYRRFVSVDLAPGTHRFVFLLGQNPGELLAERVVDVRVVNDATPTVVLAGTGSAQPYTIEVYDGSTQPRSVADRTTIALHHLAPFEGAQNAARGLVAGATCRDTAAEGTQADRDVVYRDEAVLDPGDAAFQFCSVRFVAAGVGGIELSNLVLSTSGVLRAFLVGDAINAPFEIVAVYGTQVQGTSGEGAIDPSAIIRSPTYWFDPERPTEGVTLFEETGSSDAFGVWYTFAADGHAVWYALSGGVGTAFARRDFTVFEPTRSEDAFGALGVTGSAVLRYFDCNTAELRVVLNGTDLRTLRLRRSRPIEVCVALDRND